MANPLFNDYEAFVDKFKHKKTTDDCYTPQPFYDAVLEYVDKYVLPLDGLTIHRPFYPGGDYQTEAENYGPRDIVIDNPPFSILAQIRRFYQARKIRYFLFAPGLTLFNNLLDENCTAIVSDSNITYANGAVVLSGFITNFWPRDMSFVCDGRLHKMIKEANAAALMKRKEIKKVTAKVYPVNVASAALLQKIVPYTEIWEVSRESCIYVRKLDAMGDKKIFGGGVLLSERAAVERAAVERAAVERAAVERAAVERAAVERAAVERFELSQRERNIVDLLK